MASIKDNSLASQNTTGKTIASIINKYGIVLILLLIAILAAAVTKGMFLNPVNLMNMIRQISFIAMIGIGVTIIIITTGIDLSSGSIVALAAVFAAKLAHPVKDLATGDWIKNTPQYPLIVPLLVGLGIATLAGLINGLIIAYFELPPFIVTLGMMTAARGVAFLWTDGKPIGDFSSQYNFLGGGYVLGIPMPILILIIITLFTWMILSRTKFGRHIYALGWQ